jgi:uncharacterized membrane protein
MDCAKTHFMAIAGRPSERKLILLALSLLMILVSVFLGTLLVITPVTRGLDAETYIRIQQPMTQHVTPLASVVGVLAGLATGALAWRLRRTRFASRVADLAFVCLVALGISSVIVNVPINRELQGWSPSRPPGDWSSIRDQWDAFHILRTALSVVALGCVLVLAQIALQREGADRP